MVSAPGSLALTHLGDPPSTFLMLIVGTPGSAALAPLGGLLSTFLTLMVGAPGSLALAPPREPAVDVCYIDGGRSRISSSDTSRGPAIDVSLR
jgi:hypothetical protein